MTEGRSQPTLLTIGTCNHQARIAVVAESFLRHHPAGQIFICLVDRPRSGLVPLEMPGTIFFAEELALPGGPRFLFKYEAFELCCAVKPYAINYVLQRHAISHLAYLDADILVMKDFWRDLNLRGQRTQSF